ncbi:glycosyltransferase [Leptospira mayottensis]|uniref:glycosyltransferase n=1 Tax=Leptospira mayottensis TaxID=1137606 RepID=UPI000E35C768|nr:glycosyltransferase [Leptospira mayottensis]AXR69277.1 glycosyltransferase family 1 protein [Leptospira mayottensis]
MNILFFSDEYIKSTKGMYRVWSCQALEASKHNQVAILLNREHWAFDETMDLFRNLSNVSLFKLSFKLPEEWINNRLESYSSNFLGKLGRKFLYTTCSFFSTSFFLYYLLIKLKKLNPDVVYCHSGGWPGGKLSRLLMITSRFLNIKNRILILHNFPAKQNKLLKLLYSFPRFIQAKLMEFSATEIVAVSDALKQVLEEEIFDRKLKRVYNGLPIDPTIDQPTNVDKLLWKPKEKKVVGFIGSLTPPKAPHTLVEAFRFVTSKSELALLGPGDPIYIKYLKDISSEYKNPVSFLGFHNNVNQFLEQVDLLVVPSSHFESFGMVILESMRMKKPVICTDFGGMKEVVVDGETGFVVPSRNIKVMGMAIDRLLRNPSLGKKMGIAGYNRFVEKFTSSKMNSEYEKLLEID